MKRIVLIVIVTVVLSSCVGHHNAQDFDIAKLKEATTELKAIATQYESSIPPQLWPSYLNTISAKDVYLLDTGIYIQLDRFYVEESGLFIPLSDEDIDSTKKDPSYILLIDDIYSYHLKG